MRGGISKERRKNRGVSMSLLERSCGAVEKEKWGKGPLPGRKQMKSRLAAVFRVNRGKRSTKLGRNASHYAYLQAYL